MTPNDRKYTKTHEWIRIEGDTVTVGITDHAQNSLGDVTYVEPPEPGIRLVAGGACAEIESVKAANDIYAPVSGTVSEINDRLEVQPELINQSPYEEGWIFKLSGVDSAESADLLDAASYEELLKEAENG